MLDSKTDFEVLCPNCHRMLHRGTPPMTPDELKTRMVSVELPAP